VLQRAYKTLAEDLRKGAFVTPATEWFLDNFHLISSQIVEIHRNLPRRYYRELPALATRQSAGDARIYAIAVELLRYSDSRLDLPQLTLFLNSYQRVAPLTLGELWAWPSMLKLALIENLRRLSDEIITARDARLAADAQIARIDAASAETGVQIPEKIHDAFVMQLLHRAREYDVRLSPLRAALESHLVSRQVGAEDVVRGEHQRQAASQASVANAITSLRLCTTVDWRQYVESVSLVDNILRRDPSGVFPRMDFLSRDRQRQAVEEVAEGTGEAQIRVALKVVESARQAAMHSRSSPAAHVGYYLIGKGRPELELDLAYRPKFRRRMRRFIRRNATVAYLGSITILTSALIAAALYPLRTVWWQLLAASALLLLIPMSELAIAATQKLASRMFQPQLLPRLELLDGVPDEARTVVAVPTMFTSVEGIASLLEHLEVIAIANRDPRIQFAVLSDFADAESETLPEDAGLLNAARAGIASLNERLGGENGPHFTLLHRERRWNPSERVWMGWERKRGKLDEFNRVLRGATDTSFKVRVGPSDSLVAIRYVITLDSDTQLPRDTARKLIGIIAHPLNRPIIDPRRRIVVEGYGILQPRVSVTMASAAGSLFARTYAGHTGVDPYTTAVSDVYQDLFRAGIYTGKGLYDVDAFMTALEGRVPENALLSHDLFEGLHARAALVTDAEVVDDYPSNVLTHAKRQHRWVRGDWQILWWLFPWVPTRSGIERNQLPMIARWKILDNLRRSMVPPAIIALLVAGWCFLPGPPLRWELMALASMSFAPLTRLASFFRGPRRGQGLRVFARALGEDLMTDVARVGVQLTFIAYHAYDMLHAAGLTVVRLITRRGPFLQWETAAAVAQRTRRLTMRGFYNAMTSSPAIAFGAALLVVLFRPTAMPAALPILLLWVGAPGIAFVLSRPAPSSRPSLSEADAKYLRGIAASTWRYFDTYVTADDRWLPPDNVQFDPEPRVAHRTSPTNIAMSMLSTLAAHDLDFIDTPRLLATLEATLATVDRLEHFEGHLLNWYDTQSLMPLSPKYVSTVDSGNFAAALLVIAAAMRDLARAQPDDQPGRALATRINALAARASAHFEEKHFGFLFDRKRHLFAIGYRLGEGANAARMDTSFYDLLASEARLASFVAIAKGDVPEMHWFHLGRLITGVHGSPALLSWSATMFEYLMPLLVMRSFPETLLDESCRMAVMRQIDYAATRGTPWGISESAYTAVDRAGNYQYKAFGVPGLGLKRGLGDELVVAPYATALAVLMDPPRAARNLRRLEDTGLLSDLGFYESIDYTDREGRGGVSKKGKVVPAVFAHHAGMSLVAIANALTGDRMIARFHSDTRVQATERLLQERVPRATPITIPRPLDETLAAAQGLSTPLRRYRTGRTVYPHTQFLSNGKYAVGITNAGGGASSCGNLAITRTRRDPTLDPGSSFIYLRDVRSGTVWSPTHHPIGRIAPRYMATFLPDVATFESEDEEIATKLEVAVSAEHDVELRVLSLVNNSDRVREIDVTSYVEVALAMPRDDFSHPAFGKLFIETEYLGDRGALICHRRPRAATAPGTWAMHVCSLDGRPHGPIEWETDRARFIGRGRSTANPIALDGRSLSGSTGYVLDPILSLRHRVRLPEGESIKICFAFGVAGDRDAAMALAQTYRDPSAAARGLALASAHSHGMRRHMDVSNDDAVLFERLASRVIGSDGSLRAPASVLSANQLGQNSLWKYGISGDLPILLVRVVDDELAIVRQALEAQEYWRLKGLKADVVILNEHQVSYMDEAQSVLTSMLDEGPWRMWKHQPGGAFLLRADGMGAAEGALLNAVAHAVLSTDKGDLRAHLARPPQTPVAAQPLPALADPQAHVTPVQPSMSVAVPPLAFHNGIGGFCDEGRTYAIVLEGDQETAAPWVNVIANERFGTILSNSGSATTWSGNSRENRLTPFANDPVTDRGGEALFIRDDDTGRAWSPTPGPMPRTNASGRILIRHSAGYTRFTRSIDGIHHQLDIFVDHEDPVRIAALTLSNTSQQTRHLSLFSYNDWVLGPPRVGDSRHVITDYDAAHHAVLATNPYNTEFPGHVGFAAVSERPLSATGNRRSFLGRNGSIADPSALRDDSLTGEFGAGLDPCAALQVRVALNSGETRRVVFVLGEARTRQDAVTLASKYANAERAAESLKRVQAMWDRMLSAVTVRTPDDSLDTLINRWLIYQSLSCRIWSRAGYYQPGGAFGFRDQLQDVMSLLHAAPQIAREHILRSASRQFIEGDVQHWWHEPSGRGLRSRCSDDMLWLPFVVMEYVRVTGDEAILDVVIPFLHGAPLPEHEPEAYDLPTVSNETGTLFEHCRRAIDRGITYGPHGLPLFGAGDWNDGMNRVGNEGRGESTWLGFFLFEILNDFASICDARDQQEIARRYRDTARHYGTRLEQAWDGEWYRRGYYDDGRPLGSAQNDECRIDAISQSWALLSGAVPRRQADRAMDSLRAALIVRQSRIMLLLTPAFDKSDQDPGYIKGYPPGIRENGGQYTHAAVWSLMAIARQGNGDEAAELFHMLNPINHSRTPADVSRYRTEPYVLDGDVYARPPHDGRGGWSWYTGSAGWLYRAGIESILGLRRRGSHFTLEPCIPSSWDHFSITWRIGETTYEIEVTNPEHVWSGVVKAELDGTNVDPNAIPIVEDGAVHRARITMGRRYR
jgi:cyclic beta-1,2-glucan synthetase